MSRCPRCRASFHCSVIDGGPNEPCWCMALPPLPPGKTTAAGMPDQCLCPACLKELADASAQDAKPGG